MHLRDPDDVSFRPKNAKNNLPNNTRDADSFKPDPPKGGFFILDKQSWPPNPRVLPPQESPQQGVPKSQ
jgi:hypothetical protein